MDSAQQQEIERLRRELAKAKSEASRQDRELHFRRVFESSPIGMTITRVSDARFLDANHANVGTLGYSRDELIGRTTLEMGAWLSTEDRARYLAALRAGKGVRGYATPMRNKAGDIVECRIWSELIELDGEECVLASTINVTEQQRAERLLYQSEAKYGAIFATTPDAIAISRIRDSVLLEANEAWVRITGFTREQAIGHASYEMGLWKEPTQRGRAIALLNDHGELVNFPAQFQVSGAQTREVLISAVSIELQGERCVVWSWRDVTQLRRAEEELRSNRRLLETVIDAIPMFIFAKDLNSNYVMVNKGMAEFFGLPKKEILLRQTANLPIPSEAAVKSLGDDQWVFKNLRTLEQRELLLERPDGTQAPYNSTKIPLFDDAGGPIGLVGINRDITEEKRTAERMAARTAELEALVNELETINYAVAHDLNTSLGVMSVNAGMLLHDLGGRLDEAARRSLGAIADNAQLAARLLDDLLEYARLGRVEIVRAPVAMRDLAVGAWRALAQAEPDRRVAFEAGELPSCTGDREMLEKLWTRLLSNARKYTRTRAQARVEVGYDTQQNAYFVRDNGVGFDMQYVDKLFKVFERLHRDERFEGTGIGLAIAARIVQRHGGRIWAEAAPEAGATFRFALPPAGPARS